MKIECLREKLVGALLKADRVTGKNPTLAVLSSVVIFAKENNLVIKATNLEVGVEITIPAKIYTPGICALKAYTLFSFLLNIPDEKSTTLELEEGILKVSCGKHKATIKTVSSEEFPNIPASSKEIIEIPVDDFLQVLLSVWYSSSISSIKPELSSVYVYSDKEYLISVATDSFRLAEKKIKLKKSPGDLDLLIPYRNIPDIIKIFEGLSGILSLSFDKNQLSLSLDNIYITSRLVDGIFVDYKKIIPKEHITEVTILKDDLVQAIRMMKVFSDKFNQISININGSKGTCEFTSRNSDIGEGVYAVNSKVKGESIQLNFNHKYISDCLSSIPGESVVLQFNGTGKALVVQGYTDKTFTYLVMPNK